MLELREIHYTYGRDISVDKKLIDFYEKSIVLRSADAIIKLCCDTLQLIGMGDSAKKNRYLRIDTFK